MATIHRELLVQTLEAARLSSHKINILFQEDRAKAVATRLLGLEDSGMIALDSETHIVLRGVRGQGRWMYPSHRRVAMTLTDKFLSELFLNLLADSIEEIGICS